MGHTFKFELSSASLQHDVNTSLQERLSIVHRCDVRRKSNSDTHPLLDGRSQNPVLRALQGFVGERKRKRDARRVPG